MIAKNLLELIGNTPLLELTNFARENGLKAKVLAKLEYFNPAGSVKDRVGCALIEEAEKKGLLTEKSVIIEPTSGNTGIGLAMTATVKGYRLILTMPGNMSMERRKLLQALGAEVVLTPAAEGMQGAVDKAQELADRIPNSFIPQQFTNMANPDVHRRTTAREIWRDTEGRVDIFIAGVGTGGTVTGVGEVLKEKNSAIRIIAVEPAGSPVLKGGKPGKHKIQGIGAGFLPKMLNIDIIDKILAITDEEAYTACRELARTEGLLVGISSGAAAAAAVQIARKPENKDKVIVVLFPDGGERYLSEEGLF